MRELVNQRDSVTSAEAERGGNRSVAVVGAGITGLVTAYAMRRNGVNVTLYESSRHAGGVIRTSFIDGFLAEHGPNSFVSSPAVETLLSALELQDDVVEANPSANRRYVVRDRRLHNFPISPPAMLSTGLFSARAKMRVLLEPLVRRRAEDGDESVAAFVRRRLGHEVLDYAVDPFISGIFAGDAETLSMAHAFPRVHALELAHGSMSKGLMAQRGAAKRAAKVARANGEATPPRPARARLISFLDGMQTLTDALEASLAGTLQLGCPVRLLHREGSRWMIDAGPEGATHSRMFDAVVMATPAHALSAMELPGALRKHAAPVESVEYPPVSTLTLGFHRRDVAHPLDGFGMLVPSKERRTILGALFSSSLFPDRAPTDHVSITCFVGGSRMPDTAREATDELIARVQLELSELVGVRGDPVFEKHVYWPRAIPQYTVGYQTVKSAADAMEAANPGLYLAGNYRNGVSVGDCVAAGEQMARRVEAYLTATTL